METCEICGFDIDDDNALTTPCPECDRLRCEICDAGVGTVCADCENEEGVG